jgi:hypothetical protein
MIHEDARHVWGRVTTWEPLGRYAQDVRTRWESLLARFAAHVS